MMDKERRELQMAIWTICDPRGNWQYAWNEIVTMAGLDPAAYRAPFRERTEEELRTLADGPCPKLPRVNPLAADGQCEAGGGSEAGNGEAKSI